MIHDVRSARVQACLSSRRGSDDFVVVIEDVVRENVVIAPDDGAKRAVVYGNVAADGDVSGRCR